MSEADAIALVGVTVAALVSALGCLALPRLLLRLPEGETFAATLPGRWILGVLGAVTGALLGWSLSRYGVRYDWGWALLAVLPAYLYLVVVGVAMAFVDVALHRLPDAFTLRSYPVVAALLTVASLTVGESARLVGLLVGLAVMGGLYLLLFVVYPAGMGFGDVKLSGVLGMALGFVGVQALFWGLTAGFLLGAIVSLVVLALQRSRDLKTHVPFGPSMLVGALLAMLLV